MRTPGILFLAATVPLVAAAQSTITVIKCGILVDVRAGKTVKDAIVLVEGNTIKSVGTAIKIPDDAQVVDLSRGTVLPGMLDLHCHILGDPEEGGRGSSADNALRGARNAERVLLSGFTTIRDPGGGDVNYANFSVRDAVNRGWFPGPRIVAAGRFFSITGGHGDNNTEPPEREIHKENIINGVEEMRTAVRRDVKFGADWIKIYATGGFFSVGDDPGQQHFSDEEMKVAVDEATRLGKFVAAHAHGAEGIKVAVKAGVRTVEHGTFIDDEGIELMKKHGTYLVPTLRTIEILGESMPANPSAAWQKANQLSKKHFAVMMENIGKAIKRGVKTCLGSDMVARPHGLAAQELRLHVRAGQSPMEAIRSATLVSAEALNMQNEVGSLDPGKFADIIAVEGNLLDDITVLEKVGFVMKDGRIYKNHIVVR